MAAAPTQGAISRRDFVAGLPMDMKAKEVVKQARRAGITMKQHDVYTLRYHIRKARGETLPRGRPSSASSGSEATSGTESALQTSKERSQLLAARNARFYTLDSEGQMIALVKKLGTVRARQLIDGVEKLMD